MSAFIILLLLITTATRSTATTVSATSAPSPAPSAVLREDPLFLLFPQGGDITQCLKSIMKVEGCVIRLLTSVFNHHFDVSKQCCHAIVNSGETCLSVLNPFFRPHLRSLCGVVPNLAPSHN